MRTTFHSRLFIRLLRLYASVSSIGVVVITLHNLYVNGLSFTKFFHFQFFIKVFLGVLLVVLFQFISCRRLHFAYGNFPVLTGEEERIGAWRSLIAFPSEMFWGMIAFGLIVSPTYHILMSAWKGDDLSDFFSPQVRFVLENLLFDQALTLSLATVFFTALSRICREYLSQLHYEGLAVKKTSSFIGPLMITYIALFLVTVFSMLWYTSNSLTAGQDESIPILSGIGVMFLLLSTLVFSREALDHRDRFREPVSRIRGILNEHKGLQHGRMPIVTTDEAGQLAFAFNQLQQHMAKEFEGVERELRVARQVQMRLMPGSCEENGALKIAAAYQPTKDVGGDFYDIVKLDENRTAVIIGDVSGKGMQAALIMSAVIVLLRSAIRREGEPAKLLSEMNRNLAGTFGPYSYVTMCIAIFDAGCSVVEYAGAGHLPPYLLRGGLLQMLDCSSLPLGIDPDAAYRSAQISMESGDRFVFITDGVVEAATETGDMFGFERFERLLFELSPAPDPLVALNHLISRLPSEVRGVHADDRTIVFVNL